MRWEESSSYDIGDGEEQGEAVLMNLWEGFLCGVCVWGGDIQPDTFSIAKNPSQNSTHQIYLLAEGQR